MGVGDRGKYTALAGDDVGAAAAAAAAAAPPPPSPGSLSAIAYRRHSEERRAVEQRYSTHALTQRGLLSGSSESGGVQRDSREHVPDGESGKKVPAVPNANSKVASTAMSANEEDRKVRMTPSKQAANVAASSTLLLLPMEATTTATTVPETKPKAPPLTPERRALFDDGKPGSSPTRHDDVDGPDDKLKELIRVCQAELNTTDLESALEKCSNPHALVDKIELTLSVRLDWKISPNTGGTTTTTALLEICKNDTLTSEVLQYALERRKPMREYHEYLLLPEEYDEEGLSLAGWICKNKQVDKGLLNIVGKALSQPKAVPELDADSSWLNGQQAELSDIFLHLLCDNKALTGETLYCLHDWESLDWCKPGKHMWTPLHKLCGNKAFLRSLRHAKETVMEDHTKSADEQEELSEQAAVDSWIQMVKLGKEAWQVKGGNDAKAKGGRPAGNTFLHVLCEHAHLLSNMSMAAVFIELTDVWKTPNDKEQTPLHILCKSRGCKIISSMQRLQDKQYTVVHEFWTQHMLDVWKRQDYQKYRPFDLLCENPLIDSHVLKGLINKELSFLWKQPDYSIAMLRWLKSPVEEDQKGIYDVIGSSDFQDNLTRIEQSPHSQQQQIRKLVDTFSADELDLLHRLDRRTVPTPLHMLCSNVEALNAPLVKEIARMLGNQPSKKDARDLLHKKALFEDIKQCRDGKGQYKDCLKKMFGPSLTDEQLLKQPLEPLHVLYASCKYFYIDMSSIRQSNVQGGSMFKVAMETIPEVAYLMRQRRVEETAGQDEETSLLQKLLEEIYQQDQIYHQTLGVASPAAISVDWLMARALWECPDEYETEAFMSEDFIQGKETMRDPLFCAIKIEASIMIRSIVEQLLKRKMLRNVRHLVKDIDELCKLGGDIANLVFQLLDEGGIYQVPMPCYPFLAAILDGNECETIGGSERHRWLDYKKKNQPKAAFKPGAMVSLKKDPRLPSSLTSRVAKVTDFPAATERIAEGTSTVGMGSTPQCKWLDGREMLRNDRTGYEISELRIVDGPHENWKDLGKRCGASWQVEAEPDGQKQPGKWKDSPRMHPVSWDPVSWVSRCLGDEATNRTLVEPAILAVDGAGRSDEKGLLHVLVHHVDNGNIDCEVFGTEAVTMLVSHKWNEYGRRMVAKEIILHFVMIIAPWTGITWAVAHVPSLDGQTSWLFYRLSTNDAWVAIGLCVLAAFLSKLSTRSFQWLSNLRKTCKECCNRRVCPSKSKPESNPYVETNQSNAELVQHQASQLHPQCERQTSQPEPEQEQPEPELHCETESEPEAGAKSQQWSKLRQCGLSNGLARTTSATLKTLKKPHEGHWSVRSSITLVLQLALMAQATRLLSPHTNCDAIDTYGNHVDNTEESNCRGLKHSHITVLLGVAMSCFITATWRNLINEFDEWCSHFWITSTVRNSEKKRKKDASKQTTHNTCNVCSRRCIEILPRSALLVAGIVVCLVGTVYLRNSLTSWLGWLLTCFGILFTPIAVVPAIRQATWTYLDVWNLVELLGLILAFWSATRLLFHYDHGLTTQTSAVGTALLWFRMINYLSANHTTAPFVRTFTAITVKMATFLGMLGIFVLGNWFVLLLLFPVGLEENTTEWNLTQNDRDEIEEEIGDGWAALFTSFNMMFLAGLDLKLLDHAFSPLLAKMMYVYYVVIVPLIMLNMLIALMGGEQSKVEDAEAWEGRRLRAKLLIGLERQMGGRDKEYETWHPRWIHAMFARSKLRQIIVRAHEKRIQRKQDQIARDRVHGGIAQFGKRGFTNRINVSLNAVIEQNTADAKSLELRTLCEHALSTVLPDQFAQKLLKQAGEWTDCGRSSLNTHDPFVSLSQEHAEGSEADPDPVLKDSHKMICDQFVNLLSSLSAQAHLGVDEGIHFHEEKYLWGITMEKEDTPPQSRKFRLLLVRDSFFEEDLGVRYNVGAFDTTWDLTDASRKVIDRAQRFEDDRLEQIVCGANQNPDDGYVAYKRDRLLKLRTLQQLYNEKGADRMFLVGSVFIAASEHHPLACDDPDVRETRVMHSRAAKSQRKRVGRGSRASSPSSPARDPKTPNGSAEMRPRMSTCSPRWNKHLQ